MWIGYGDVDRLISYPDAHKLSGCSSTIREATTYPRTQARANAHKGTTEPPASPPHKSHVIRLPELSIKSQNVAIPTITRQLLKCSQGNYVRHFRGTTASGHANARQPNGPPRVHATSSHTRHSRELGALSTVERESTQHSRECKHSTQSRVQALSAVERPRPRRPGQHSGRHPCAGCRQRRPG